MYPGDRNGYTAETIGPRLERLYRAGLTLPEMGERLGLHPSTVRYWMHRTGLPLERKPVTDERVDRMVALWHEGLKQRDIAARVGLSEQTVRKYLRGRGVDTFSRVNRTMRPIAFGAMLRGE